MDAASFHSIWTVLTLSAFIALIVWAWSSKQKSSFNQASRIPLEDDDEAVSSEEAETREEHS